MARVTFTRGARIEARDARLWLKDRQPRTVEGFRRRVEEARRLLSDFHMAGRADAGKTRLLPLDPYPYSLVYRILPDRVSVIAVPHNNQDRRYWLDP